MSNILDPDRLRYFFGPHFNIEVAIATIANYEHADNLERELLECIKRAQPHLGIQFVGYHDIDTGMSSVAMIQKPGGMSGVSFFADSKHRVFGGHTLVCVPLAFCSSLYKPAGEHIVYRHTFKRPKLDAEELKAVMSSGTPEQKLKTFVFTKCRDGYETIPGMSYVGITSRTWQKRYLEHTEKALEASTSTHFHKAIRDMQGQKVVCVHDVSAYGFTKADARAYESMLISKSTLWPLGLNMKP